MQLETKNNSLAAILTNDWHLCPKPPAIRSCEPNWLDTQYGYIQQVVNLLPNFPDDTPIINAGDLFDKYDYNYPSNFISWCLDVLPQMYVVAGQHDLPNHRMQDLDRSLLGLMIKLGKVKLLKPKEPTYFEKNLVAYGFSWNQTVEPLKEKDDRIHLAAIHAFIWTKNTGYLGVSEESRLANWCNRLEGYSSAVFGDNHKQFFNTKTGPCPILNNGTFMIRRRDELDHKPCVGLLYTDGSITRHFLDVSKDKYLDMSELKQIIKGGSDLDESETQKLIEEWEKLGDKGLDYVDAVNRWCDDNKVDDDVRNNILEWMKQ